MRANFCRKFLIFISYFFIFICILTRRCSEVYILLFNSCVKFHAKIYTHCWHQQNVGGLLFIGPVCILGTALRNQVKPNLSTASFVHNAITKNTHELAAIKTTCRAVLASLNVSSHVGVIILLDSHFYYVIIALDGVYSILPLNIIGGATCTACNTRDFTVLTAREAQVQCSKLARVAAFRLRSLSRMRDALNRSS